MTASRRELRAATEAIASAKWNPDSHVDKEQVVQLKFFNDDTLAATSYLKLYEANNLDAQDLTALILSQAPQISGA